MEMTTTSEGDTKKDVWRYGAMPTIFIDFIVGIKIHGASRLVGLTACERTHAPFETMGYLGVFS